MSRATLLPGDPRHGTANGYSNLGCRCDACRDANTAYMRERKIGAYRPSLCECGNPKTITSRQCQSCSDAERRAEHGTESGYTGGCRCDPCMDASAAARRARRAANPEAARQYDRDRYYGRPRQRTEGTAS